MFPWLNRVLFDEAGEGDGGGGGLATLIDPNGHEGDETDKPGEKKADPTEIRLKAMETEITNLRKKNEELSESERSWAKIAQNRTRQAESDDEPEPEDPATPEIVESSDQFLDDVSKKGLAAILERGVPTMAQVQKLINDTVSRTVAEVRTDSTFDQQIAEEFPEIAADTRRVKAGGKPESELFAKAAEIYRAAIALDPSLKSSKSALLISARQAKAQLQAEGKLKADDTSNRQQNRRQRIDAQRPDTSRGTEDDGETTLTASQKQMAKNLGVSEDKFLKNLKRGSTRGRD